MNQPTTSEYYYIGSTRGIIITHNHRNHPLPLLALKRWLRYNRQVLNAEKIDVYALGTSTMILEELLPCAAEIDCQLGLYTDASAQLPNLALLKEHGLWDITLNPESLQAPFLEDWLKGCAESDITIHLRLAIQEEYALLEKFLDKYPIRTVTLGHSPITQQNPSSSFNIESIKDIAQKINALDISLTIQDLPYCALPDSLWPNISNSKQRARDHLDYIPTSLTLAQSIHGHRIFIGEKIIRMALARHTLHKTPVDEILLPFILKRSYRYMINRFVRRLTEHLNLAKSVPREKRPSHYDTVLNELQELPEYIIPTPCKECSLHRLCDKALYTPGTFNPKTIEGDEVMAPMHFRRKAKRYMDTIDMDRLAQYQPSDTLIEEAQQIITQQKPTHVLNSDDYSVEGSFSESMEGGVKWWSVTRSEKISTPLGTFALPLTIAVEIGGGIADYIGFSFGQHIKIMCPMEAYRHTLAIHINAQGQYLLLRDGLPVRPVEFEGLSYQPLRLGDRLQPRLSIWNIDDCILTQSLRIWECKYEPHPSPDTIKYSIIIVSTQFSRRLQAVLHNLAHQENFDFNTLEIIIAYVPGLDATDDLIDSLAYAYPELNIIRSAFAEKQRNAKGHMVNESAKLVHGEWIMLLDSDIILPPDYLARIESVSDTESFIAPDGRRLLTPETTAKLLLGDIKPWEDWETLIQDSGEFRHRETRGIPVGFCQCFKAHYLKEFPYIEVEHFEIADMDFGIKMLKEHGPEHRLSGAPVLHLDHNGSQWYGTKKQL